MEKRENPGMGRIEVCLRMDQGLPEQLLQQSLEEYSIVVVVAVSLEESRSASGGPQKSEQLMRSLSE